MVVRVPFLKACGGRENKTTRKQNKTKKNPKPPTTSKPKEFPETNYFPYSTHLLFFSPPRGWQAKLGASLSEKSLLHAGRLEVEGEGAGVLDCLLPTQG